MNFDNVLGALCANVELRNNNDRQQVFVISDAKEAKLAFDVLTAHGFEAKVYPENNESKLYVTHPAAEDQTAQKRFDAALAYALALKHIKTGLDALCQQSAQNLQSPEYSLSFASLPASGGKQILINVLPASAADAPAATVAQPVRTIAAAPTAKPATGTPAPRKAYMRQTQEETMFSGPSLLKDNNKILSKKAKEKQEADGYFRQLSLYIKGNSAVAFSIIVVILIGLLSLFSMFVVSKGFLCPDLAHVKDKRTWYCQSLMPEEEEEKKDQIQ